MSTIVVILVCMRTVGTMMLVLLVLLAMLIHFIIALHSDYIKPWIHYIPIREDLSDLLEKLHWAEAHPREAKQISDQATELSRYLGSPKGFGQMFNEHWVQPLKEVIGAYQPVSTTHEGMSWREVITKKEGEDVLVPYYECEGRVMNDCKKVMRGYFKWRMPPKQYRLGGVFEEHNLEITV